MWDAFIDLSNAREIGDLPQAIPWREIAAYSREVFPLRIWEKRLIRRVDDKVLMVIRAKSAPPPAPTDEKPARIPMTNTQGVGAFLRGLAASKKKGGKDG